MRNWPYPFWIAHRGGGHLAPENTLAAFRTGLRLGWTMMECDVKLSADGVPYLMHDDTLDRTTNACGPADQMAWADLRRLDAGRWHSEWFRRASPASLEEVATLLRLHGAAVNLEIKPMPGQAAHTGEAVSRAVRHLWHGAERAPLMSSFAPEALDAARATAPEIPRALLSEGAPRDLVATAVELGCCAIAPHHLAVDAELTASAHAAGLAVVCYTVNTVSEADRLISLGIDGLITDALDRFDPTKEPRPGGPAQLR